MSSLNDRHLLASRGAALAALLATTAVVLWPATSFEFLNFDDDVYVTANPHVIGGLSAANARWAFTNTESGHFHPLTWLSHQLDVTLFGLNAGAHHRTSLALHLFAVLACFAAFRALLRREPQGEGVAWFAAAVFALHPLRLESVAWVAARKDVLSGVLFFLALWAWARHVQSTDRRWAWATAALYFFALLAKPTVLPFPLLLLLLDAWPLRRLSAQTVPARLREKAPMLGAMGVFAGVAFFGQRSAGAVQGLDTLGVPERVGNASAALLAYVGRLLFPGTVSLFHPLHPLPQGLGVAAALLVVGASVAALVSARVPLPLRVAWGWWVLLLLPVSGLVQIGGQFISDRWLYLPTAGVAAGLAAWAGAALERRARAGLAAAVVLAFAGLTRWQLPHYQDSEHVFRNALEVDAANFMAHNNLGVALEAKGAFAEAEAHYEESVRLHPTWPNGLTNLANARARRGDYAGATELYGRALARRPDHALAHYNLALALGLQGRWQAAVPHYEAAARLRPADAQAALGLGVALVNTGQLAEADEALARAVALQPTPSAFAHRARALRLLGRPREAEVTLARALALDPAHALAREERARLGAAAR